MSRYLIPGILSIMLAGSVLAASTFDDLSGQATIHVGDTPTRFPAVWPSNPPEGCPFEPSTDIVGVLLTGRYANYTNADGWYPTWAADGNLYSSWGDGDINGEYVYSYPPDVARVAAAKIEGDNPMNLIVTSLGSWHVPATPWEGRYPCGNLIHDGVWYYGTYCLANQDPSFTWDIMGPFVGWHISSDYGQTWTAPIQTPDEPLFSEPLAPVKFGAPVFVDFGQDMEHSPDGKAYIVAHGAVEPDPYPRAGNGSWINADQIFMARVTPSIETINEESQYEYFAGRDQAGDAIWSYDFNEIQPLIDWNNHLGFVTMTYNAPLHKYLIIITDGHSGDASKYDTFMLESDRLTGPFRMVSYMKDFGEQGYYVHALSKFISADGRKAWLIYNSNWFDRNHIYWGSNPPGSEYALSLHEIELLAPGYEPPPVEPIVNPGFEIPAGPSFYGPEYPQAEDWDGMTGTATHAAYSYANNNTLGARFGFNVPGNEPASQTLTDTYMPNTEYIFKGYGVDAGINDDDLRFSLGYDDGEGFVELANTIYDLNFFEFQTWTLLDGVTYTTGDSGPELGNNVVLRIEGAAIGFPHEYSGVFYDEVALVITRIQQIPATSVAGLVFLVALVSLILVWYKR